jgi:hypothetical protein
VSAPISDAELIPRPQVGDVWRPRRGGMWRTVIGIHAGGVEWTASPDRHEFSRWETWDRWVCNADATAELPT